MGAGSSSSEIAAKVRGLGEQGAYTAVSDAVQRFDLSGAFLVEAPTDEVSDFIVSRCPSLATVQRRRVLFELDCLKRRERTVETIHEASDDERKERMLKERWRDEGSEFIGSRISRQLWDELGKTRVRSHGKIVAWCADSSFLDSSGKRAPLWRAKFDSISDLVELEETEVLAAIAEHEATKIEAEFLRSSKKRQRIKAEPVRISSRTEKRTAPRLELPLRKKPKLEMLTVAEAYDEEILAKRRRSRRGDDDRGIAAARDKLVDKSNRLSVRSKLKKRILLPL